MGSEVMANCFSWAVVLLGCVLLSEAAIPVSNSMPTQSSTMMAPCEKETGIAYWRCVRVAALKMPSIGSAVRDAIFKTAAKPVFSCPGNHASILELILDKKASAKLNKPDLEEAMLAEVRENLAEVDITVGGSTGKLFVNPSRIHVHEVQDPHPEKLVHVVHVTIEDDEHGLIIKELLKAADAHELNPFPETCPVTKATVLCADYLVLPEMRASECSNASTGVLDISFNRTNAESISQVVLEDAVLAEAREALKEIDPSRIHAKEKNVASTLVRVIRIKVDMDIYGDLVHKAAAAIGAHMLNPFPDSCPVASYNVVCPEVGSEAAKDIAGASYRRSQCAQLELGNNLPYPADGYGVKTAVTLSQCVAACNDNIACTGFSHSDQLGACHLKSGVTQLTKTEGPSPGACQWDAYRVVAKPTPSPLFPPTPEQPIVVNVHDATETPAEAAVVNVNDATETPGEAASSSSSSSAVVSVEMVTEAPVQPASASSLVSSDSAVSAATWTRMLSGDTISLEVAR